MTRLYREDDFETVIQIWYEAQCAAMPELMAREIYSFEDGRNYFKKVITVENQIWVYESDDRPVAFLALNKDFIDRLYVDPKYHRRGIGQALMDYAKVLSPNHLWLCTHVANTMARSFYEKNGFIAEKFGISPPPESEPDVEYHWRKP